MANDEFGYIEHNAVQTSTNQQPAPISTNNPSNCSNETTPTVANDTNGTACEEPVCLQAPVVVHTSQISLDNPLYDGNDNIIPILKVTNSTNNTGDENPTRFQRSIINNSGDSAEYEEPVPSNGLKRGDKPMPFVYISMLNQAQMTLPSLNNGPIYETISPAIE